MKQINLNFLYPITILFSLLFIFSCEARSESFWALGKSVDTSHYEFSKTENFANRFLGADQTLIFGRTSDNLDFWINFGSSTNETYEKDIRKFQLNSKIHYSNLNLGFQTGAALVYDFSRLSFNDGAEFRHENLLFAPLVGVSYKFTNQIKMYLNSMILFKTLSLPSNSDTVEYTLDHWTNINFLLCFKF
jgi:hypothetical protein